MLYFFKKHSAFLLVFVVLLFAVKVNAQDQASTQASRFFEAQFRAADATRMVAGQTLVQLWGVQTIEGMPAQFNISSRSALDNALGRGKARCELKKRTEVLVFAQCTNGADLDLGLYMLQQGYAIVNRAIVYGSAFEDPYIQAEMEAQNQRLGVWARNSSGGSTKEDDGNLTLILGAVLLLFILGVFSMLTLTIMKGFQKVTDAQNQSMDMMARERELRDKEREIFASMLDSEIKANKSKIEAYLVVYDEMLKDVKDSDKTPKFKNAGDIVQAQPALDRSVFDRNTDKLDILGDKLSSHVVHFYARVKNKPDYINLEPDMAVEEAREIVERAYNNAQRLNKISDQIIDMFTQGGHSSEEEY